MIKALEKAIERVKNLPEDQQRYAAHVLEQIASTDEVYRLSDEERRLVRDGLADLDAGRIVSDSDIDAFWRRHRA